MPPVGWHTEGFLVICDVEEQQLYCKLPMGMLVFSIIIAKAKSVHALGEADFSYLHHGSCSFGLDIHNMTADGRGIYVDRPVNQELFFSAITYFLIKHRPKSYVKKIYLFPLHKLGNLQQSVSIPAVFWLGSGLRK